MTSEPTIFGRYQLIEPIAKGGMAEVFKAKLVVAAGTEKMLCIKRILPVHSSNQDFISLFVKEAKISLNLSHGNITQVFDFGEVDGVYFLAMEYISGQDLNSALKRVNEVNKTLSLPGAIYIAAEVCKGLQYAHGYTDAAGKLQAVVHRDVTPHNILVSYSGQVKLTDFGIALAATKAGVDDEVVRGKACYLSPEQAAGNPATPASDLFTLGAVIYEMLTGVCPFEGDSEREILERVKTLEIDLPSKINGEVDPDLDAVVMKAIAKDPRQRYPRAGDLQVALTQILHQRWPDFTAEQLSESFKDLFAWEIAKAEGEVSSDHQRDRLLFQLSRAGVAVDHRNATTAELLELGTVAIPGAALTDPPSPRRKMLLAGGGGLALIGLVVVIVMLLFPTDRTTRSDVADGGGPPPLESIIHHTEHLTPPSAKEPVVAPAKKPSPSEKKQPVKAPVKMAYLNCNSWPWSVVYINGRKLQGNTPLFRVRVPAGRHRIKFVNPELGLAREVSVTLEAGNTKTITVALQQ